MSAGICIMNKNAIALAADSAVTIGAHLAIHNSANKLFALSKVAPVGIIIYSSAELMSIPMEIIIKQYKKDLAQKTFDALTGYVEDFISYLLHNKDLFHFSQNEGRFVKSVYADLLNGLNGDYTQMISRKIDQVKRELTQTELAAIQKDTVDATIQFVHSLPAIPDYDIAPYITTNYSTQIKDYISTTYAWVPASDLDRLTEAVCSVFNKEFFRNGYVGMAFAGFGSHDIFPQMYHIHLSGIISESVRYVVREQLAISEDNPATISPFAQTDVMQTFLFGINDSFINALADEIPCQIDTIFRSIEDENFAEGKKQAVFEKLASATPNIINQIISRAQKQYLWPISQSVATLPIDELSMLAESMINITSLRRKVAIDSNIGTVGGPIDVAMITKSDGFIWMKRKHYFDQSYNPQYFYSHYWLQGGINSEHPE